MTTTTLSTIPAPNITDVVKFAEYANIATGNVFWNYLLLAIWITLFFAIKGFRTEVAFVSASFICAILSLILAILGLINGGPFMIGFLIATAVGMFFL
jgi:hypothetical protein